MYPTAAARASQATRSCGTRGASSAFPRWELLPSIADVAIHPAACLSAASIPRVTRIAAGMSSCRAVAPSSFIVVRRITIDAIFVSRIAPRNRSHHLANSTSRGRNMRPMPRADTQLRRSPQCGGWHPRSPPAPPGPIAQARIPPAQQIRDGHTYKSRVRRANIPHDRQKADSWKAIRRETWEEVEKALMVPFLWCVSCVSTCSCFCWRLRRNNDRVPNGKRNKQAGGSDRNIVRMESEVLLFPRY